MMLSWLEIADAKPPVDETPVLLFMPAAAADEDFPGHPYLIFTGAELTDRLIQHWRFTHWVALSAPAEGKLGWLEIAQGIPQVERSSGVLWSPNAPTPEQARVSGPWPYRLTNPFWAANGNAAAEGSTHYLPVQAPR